MTFFKDGIIKDLEKGSIYTEREISSIVCFNENAIVLCDETSIFQDTNTENKYLVLEKMETFIHKCENDSYHFPSKKTIVYKIKKLFR